MGDMMKKFDIPKFFAKLGSHCIINEKKSWRQLQVFGIRLSCVPAVTLSDSFPHGPYQEMAYVLTQFKILFRWNLHLL